MYSECLPVSRVPHSTPLFTAYLHDFERVSRFYARPPFSLTWLAEEARKVGYDHERRVRVSDVLESQNRAFGSGDRAFANIRRLRNGAAVAVTGQQVSLFGGPLFSILKALTTVRIAEEATRAGVDCVPVFWLATEDHDLAEVNYVVLPGQDASLERLEAPTRGVADAPVGEICLGAGLEAVVGRAAELLGAASGELLRETYAPGTTLGDAFARLLARVFREWGVILLDASDRELHAVAAPVYEKAIRHAESLLSRLEARGHELRDNGFHEQVKVTPSTTLLFAVRDHTRVPIHRQESRFTMAGEGVSEADLLKRVQAAPEQFSPNVLLRPVVQDFLLPTLAYVGGPSEIAYFAQAAVVYEEILGRATPVLPRLSVTLVEPHIKRLLERYHLRASDTFVALDQIREILAERALPSALQTNFDMASSRLDESLRSITSSLQQLDPTLVEAAERAGAKMRHQLEHLRARAANAELRRSEVLARHAALLSAALYPDRSLQERVVGSIYFLARYPELLDSLYREVSFTCPDHQVLFL